MSLNGKISYLNKKWGLFFVILLPYFFISFKIMGIIKYPYPSKIHCGTGIFMALIAHIGLAFIITIIIMLKMFLMNGYSAWNKLIVFLIIIIPPIVSLYFFK